MDGAVVFWMRYPSIAVRYAITALLESILGMVMQHALHAHQGRTQDLAQRLANRAPPSRADPINTSKAAAGP